MKTIIYCWVPSHIGIYGNEKVDENVKESLNLEEGTSRQRSGKGAIRKRFPLQKMRQEKTKLTIKHLYHEYIL